MSVLGQAVDQTITQITLCNLNSIYLEENIFIFRIKSQNKDKVNLTLLLVATLFWELSKKNIFAVYRSQQKASKRQRPSRAEVFPDQTNTKPHLIRQSETNDLFRDLDLTKKN